MPAAKGSGTIRSAVSLTLSESSSSSSRDGVWKESTTASTTAIAIFRRTRTGDLAMPTLTAGLGK